MASVDIERVAGIIREVAEIEILPRWRNLASGDITHKSKPGDVVTVADHAAEAALERQLLALLPGSTVVGEETVFTDPDVLSRLADDAPVWVLDPIDGTRAFAEGRSTFDVLVALVQNGVGVAGWIYAPAEQDFYLGEVGGGVIHRSAEGPEKRLRAPARAGIAELSGICNPRVLRDRGLPDAERVLAGFRTYTAPTCAGHNYARILRGESDFLINFSTQPWDHLPGLTLAAAGGWHAARHDGHRFAPLDPKGGILVAPSRDNWSDIHGALLPFLGQSAPTGR
jgi:fructose-1,6-bisphosphatase/inositol monophosphatase family enzyme